MVFHEINCWANEGNRIGERGYFQSTTEGPVIAAEILHVDIAGPLETLQVAEVECLIVFWWLDYPVGQLRQSGNPGRSIALKPLVESSVDTEVLRLAQQTAERERSQTVPDDLVVSVVICTRDRPGELARCLASLPKQTRVPDQVVVVDNAPSDGRTQEVAVKAEAIYVREDRPGLGFARNAGVRAASGHIIVYTDDDVRLHSRWLERMVNAFDDERVMAVTGLVLPAELETEAQMFFEELGLLVVDTSRLCSIVTSSSWTKLSGVRYGRLEREPAWRSAAPSLIVSDCSTNGSVQDRPDALRIPNFGIGYSRMDGNAVTSLEPLSSIITVVRWQAFENRSSFTCAATWSHCSCNFSGARTLEICAAHSS